MLSVKCDDYRADLAGQVVGPLVLCFVSTRRVHALSGIPEDRPAPMLIGDRSMARKRDRPFAPFCLTEGNRRCGFCRPSEDEGSVSARSVHRSESVVARVACWQGQLGLRMGATGASQLQVGYWPGAARASLSPGGPARRHLPATGITVALRHLTRCAPRAPSPPRAVPAGRGGFSPRPRPAQSAATRASARTSVSCGDARGGGGGGGGGPGGVGWL